MYHRGLIMQGIMQEKSSRSFGDIDILVKQVPNKYLLVNATRIRAQQLVAHIAEPMVEGANPEKAVSTALNEIAEGRLDISSEPAPITAPE